MVEMENPFRFGGLVTGKDFADREREISEIMKDLRGGLNIVLFSPRRMGKSSLLAEIMRRHGAEMLFVYVDLYGVTTKTRLVEVYMSALVSGAYGTARRVAAGLGEIARSSRWKLRLSENGVPRVELSRGEPTVPEIQDILDIPEEVARKRGKRIVVMFDEFQEISSLDGVVLLKAMRSRMQTHKHVSYIYAGSKKHLLLSIFEEKEGAFFKSARSMELGPIPHADFERFLIDKFSAAGGRLDEEFASGILAACGANTYYAQQIAFELFNISLRPKMPVDLESAITAALAHQSPAFQFLWDSMKSPTQRTYLLAVAKEGRSTPRHSLVTEYNLKSLSHIQRAVAQLDARGITERGEIVDPMFVQWLKRLGNGHS
jgi:hypothetical protein